MTQVTPEGPRIPQEPVVKMASEVMIQEIQAILGDGRYSWVEPGLFKLAYPELAVSILLKLQDNNQLALRNLSIGDKEVMQLEDAAVVLDMDDGSVTFVDPVHEEEFSNSITGFTLSTRQQKLVDYFDRAVDTVPAGSREAYYAKRQTFCAGKKCD